MRFGFGNPIVYCRHRRHAAVPALAFKTLSRVMASERARTHPASCGCHLNEAWQLVNNSGGIIVLHKITANVSVPH
jgi:hypothetical protein